MTSLNSSMLFWRWAYWAIGVCVTIAMSESNALGDAPDAPAAPGPAAHAYIGSENTKCIICHSAGAIPPKDTTGIGTRVTLKEAAIWQMQDKHSRAYETLDKPVAQAMSKLLGYDVRQDTRCLSCHVGTCEVEGKETPARLSPPPETLLAGGVGCQACHGPADGWVNVHQEAAWRTKTREDRLGLGLRETRDPIARAELCVSCHLGNSAEGKRVTHEMYAAGHPPLQGFEIETFARIMPTHAKRITERPDLVESLKIPADELSQSRAVLTAAAVAMRASVRLLADGSAPASKTGWPELALFDCSACHHELRVPSWRQHRDITSLLGRPAVRSWPLAMYRVVDGNALRTLEPIHQALGRQPFGRPEAVHRAAQAVLPALDAKLEELRVGKFDRAATVSSLKRICDTGLDGVPDYDTARQLAWAFRILYDELGASPNVTAPFDSSQATKIKEILDRFETELHLAIGSESVQRNVDESLKAASDYSPEVFQARIKELRQMLNGD